MIPPAPVSPDPEPLDRSFTVVYPHRVRFTRHAFAPGNPVLRDLLASPASARARALVVIDAGLALAAPALLGEVCDYFAAHHERLELLAPPLVLAGGEAGKNSWDEVHRLHQAIDRHHLDRHAYVIGIGGGALLDLCGFAAATAHRGCRHVRFPSTTLAQADSGVGVKNGINAFGKKNFVGTFAPPWAVVNDFQLLRTLEPRDLRCGYAEAVKVALIRDGAFFEELEARAERLRAFDFPTLEGVVRRCARLHVEHIAGGGDPFETGSARPLDFGHWAAHRLEPLSGFRLRHGEAVAIGLAVDTLYSSFVGPLPQADAERVLHLLERLGFRLFAPELAARTAEGGWSVLRGLEDFREHLGGQLTLTLLHGLGQGREVHAYDSARFGEIVAHLRARARPPL